jgi:hypothetical protein
MPAFYKDVSYLLCLLSRSFQIDGSLLSATPLVLAVGKQAVMQVNQAVMQVNQAVMQVNQAVM